MEVKPQPGSSSRLTRRWLLAIVSGAALSTVSATGTHAIGTLVTRPDDVLGPLLVAAVASPAAALTLAWRWLPPWLRSVGPVISLASVLLLGFYAIGLNLAASATDPDGALRPLWLLAFPVGVLTVAPLRESVGFLRAAARSGAPVPNGPGPLWAGGPIPQAAPVGRPSPAPRPPAGPGARPRAVPVPPPPAPPAPSASAPARPPSATPTPAPPAPAPPAASAPPTPGRPGERTDTDLRAITVAREVETVIEDAARQVAPLLEKRLVAYYGTDWLATINARRRRAGHKPGRRLRDFRFCLAVLGHDPATKGWANDACRQAAISLNHFGFNAVHRSTMTATDLEQARRVARRLIDNLPRS